MKTMIRITVPVLLTVLFSVIVSSSSAQIFQRLSGENFPNTFNLAYNYPVNSTINGKAGDWSAYSSDAKSTVAVTGFANSQSAPYCTQLVNNSNDGSSQSYSQITSPEMSLSGVVCTGKVDLFCWIYTEELSAANTGTRLKIELFDGTTWNTVWQKSAAQLLSDYGLNTWSQVYIMLSPANLVSNFKYRFILQTPAGNTNTTKIRIDECELFNYSCWGKASVGNLVWIDTDADGMQDAGEKGFKGMPVELYNSSNTLVASTITGEDGAYHFLGVDPGTYRLHFRPSTPGYINSMPKQGSDFEMDSDPDNSTGNVMVSLVQDEFNSSIDFGIVPGAVLPVKLISFAATQNNNDRKVELSWLIEGNTDMNSFELERSIDGRNFSAVAVIFPKDGDKVQYSYFDLSVPVSDIVYYRLFLKEKNGSQKFSNIVMVKRNQIVGQNTMQLTPNPARSNTAVRFATDKQGIAKVVLTDMSGKTVAAFDKKVNPGTTIIEIGNLESYQRGFYMLQVRMSDATWTAKLILQ